ncbi:substrate-binding family protein [Paenibacillus taihuensis]|uniref:Substrate-binding family protein n=1 Tax=Paenibacillus taihuensis TaxID=1156355 RepID=A0A3D9R3A2_9BACL|nr:substrate-binding domain-containing protein [Paenibacillus taihuensis]REE70464.1 substrate-binding family protein [Paenibacillus taihuensis]
MKIIVPHEYAPSHEANIYTLVISYGLMLIAAVIAWVTGRKSRATEPLFFLKLLGYVFLSVFTFRIDHFALPLGLLIAYMMMRRTQHNRPVKQTAILFGGMLFLFSFYPLAERLDELVDPPHKISTYLNRNLDPTKQGFNMTVLDYDNKVRALLVEKEPESVELYKELAASSSIESGFGIVPMLSEPNITIELRQSHKQARFSELQLQFDREGRYFTLYNGGNIYNFESTEQFRKLFKQKVKPLVEPQASVTTDRSSLKGDSGLFFRGIAGAPGANNISIDQLRSWKDAGLRMVLAHFFFPQLNIPYVIVDNLTGGYLATEHLVSLGHRRIGIIVTGNSLIDINQEFSLRLQGYKLALTQHGIAFDESLVSVMAGNEELEEMGYEGTKQLLALPDKPTAIFATSDYKAFGAIRAGKEQGIAIPGQLSIVGYDNVVQSRYTSPALTTVNQNTERMGKRAVELLLRPWSEKDMQEHWVKEEIVPKLLVRNSTTVVGITV